MYIYIYIYCIRICIYIYRVGNLGIHTTHKNGDDCDRLRSTQVCARMEGTHHDVEVAEVARDAGARFRACVSSVWRWIWVCVKTYEFIIIYQC